MLNTKTKSGLSLTQRLGLCDLYLLKEEPAQPSTFGRQFDFMTTTPLRFIAFVYQRSPVP
ncbi:MAG: hypothetical protein V7K14_30725 [Nostoc sp.]|uniref:hypothetical protein n=1 Tax=Nostoc sp. TaxID=1180 RepID=UPI002FF8989C